MSIGKKRTAVDFGLHATTTLDESSGEPTLMLPHRFSEVMGPPPDQIDPIRWYTGKLWTSHNDNIVFGYNIPGDSPFSIEYGDPPIEEGGDLFPVISQYIKLIPKENHRFLLSIPPGYTGAEAHTSDMVFDLEKWFEFVDNELELANPSKSWQDCPFEYSVPYLYKETLDLAISNILTLVADVDSEYNFYVNGYENKIDNVEEKLLPCLYSFLSEKESGYLDENNSWYNKHISLMGNIIGVYKDILNEKGEKVGERSTQIADYFKSWQSGYDKLKNDPQKMAKLNEKFRNFIFSQVDVDFLTKFSAKKELFPMHMDIKFSTGAGTQAAGMLREAELSANLINHVQASSGRGEIKFVEQREFLTEKKGKSGTRLLGSKILPNQSYKTWDITEWWRGIAEESSLKNTVVFGRNKCNETKILDECRPQIANLLKIVLLGRIRTLIRQNNRNLKEIFEEGKTTYSESVFYQIDKFTRGSVEPIQSFFIPNSDELGICNFIDTQVKYNTEYRYKIYAYRLVFGTKYRYEKEEPGHVFDDTLRGKYDDPAIIYDLPRFKVFLEPYLKLVKVPYFESGVNKILDRPPVAPDVNIIPYRGMSDRILFNLNANVGDYKLVPQVIEPGEEALISEMEKIQKVSRGDPINYASDDPPRLFEIYRLEKMPKSYRDFSGNIIKQIPTEFNGTNLSAVSYVDDIESNKKYYYTFRTTDVHGHLSYPSPVFEVEMVEEDGAVYLLVDTPELKEPSHKVPTKTINKNIYIIPSFPHRIIDMDKTDAGRNLKSATKIGRDEIVLGLTEEGSVWDKNFKFRFISKNTGRKFDVNVKFKYAYDYDRFMTKYAAGAIAGTSAPSAFFDPGAFALQKSKKSVPGDFSETTDDDCPIGTVCVDDSQYGEK